MVPLLFFFLFFFPRDRLCLVPRTRLKQNNTNLSENQSDRVTDAGSFTKWCGTLLASAASGRTSWRPRFGERSWGGGTESSAGGGRNEAAWSKPQRGLHLSLAFSCLLFQTRSLILPFQLFTVDYNINNKYILLCVFSRLISKNLTVALIKAVCTGSKGVCTGSSRR